MIHADRIFSIATIATAEELAKKLSEHAWTGCTGFRFGALLFLNDSFGADGAQEYAVFDEATAEQIESITFGWCSYAEALRYIENLAAGTLRTRMSSPTPRLDHPPQSCHLCA